jgi:hypothetical protein
MLSNALRKYVALLAPAGAYLVTVHRRSCTTVPELHCAFETESDALEIGKALGAELGEKYRGWASQHVFRYDVAQEAIGSAVNQAALPIVRKREPGVSTRR